MTWTADPDIDDAPHTIGRWIVDRATRSPERTAIDDRGVTTDYATLAARATQLADALRQAGYGPGDRVATVSGNSTDHVVAFFACAISGIAFVPLSWRLTPRELAGVLTRSDPALVLIEDEHAALAGEALRVAAVSAPVALLGTTGVEGSVPRAACPRPRRPVRDDDPLLVIFTSGSEAAPKGVVLTHRHARVGPVLLGRIPPRHRVLGFDLVVGDQFLGGPLRFLRILEGVRVQQHPVPVAGHRHLTPEPLLRVVVQIQCPQPLPERQPVLLVPEHDLNPKLLVRHARQPTYWTPPGRRRGGR